MSGQLRAFDGDDRLLRAFFLDDAVGPAPSGLLERSLDRTRASRQEWPWRAVLRDAIHGGPSPARWIVVLVGLLVVASLTWGLLALVGQRTPAPAPSPEVRDGFLRPFSFVAPPGTKRWHPENGEVPEMVAWIQGPDSAAVASDRRIAGEDEASGATRGIVVAAAVTPWTHGCASSTRELVRTAPSDFLSDLRDVSGAGLGAFGTMTVDGRPAVTSTLTPSRSRCGTDVHLTGTLNQVMGTVLSLSIPSRFIAFEVQGQTVFIQIWARTPEDLEAWLPDAMTFVEHLQFLEDK